MLIHFKTEIRKVYDKLKMKTAIGNKRVSENYLEEQIKELNTTDS